MRSIMMGTVLALATLVAVPAMAHEHQEGQFPMPAATFKANVEARQTKAREHMEQRAAKVSPEQAKEIRAKFDAGAAKIDAEVNKVTADGTVTKEEAQEVRQVVREVRGGHHGKHARHEGKKHDNA